MQARRHRACTVQLDSKAERRGIRAPDIALAELIAMTAAGITAVAALRRMSGKMRVDARRAGA
jgi:hypothetical protein